MYLPVKQLFCFSSGGVPVDAGLTVVGNPSDISVQFVNPFLEEAVARFPHVRHGIPVFAEREVHFSDQYGLKVVWNYIGEVPPLAGTGCCGGARSTEDCLEKSASR